MAGLCPSRSSRSISACCKRLSGCLGKACAACFSNMEKGYSAFRLYPGRCSRCPSRGICRRRERYRCRRVFRPNRHAVSYLRDQTFLKWRIAAESPKPRLALQEKAGLKSLNLVDPHNVITLYFLFTPITLLY